VVPQSFPSLAAASRWCAEWLRGHALPLWATAGVDPDNGGFREGLTMAGEPWDPRRRTRVQARQVFVFATAATEGLSPESADVAQRGLRFMLKARRPDGLFANALTPAGDMLDGRVRLYEHAFVMLALSAMHRLEPEGGHDGMAAEVLGALGALRHAAGGYREEGEHPFQANAHMHLLEAALAWEAVCADACWAALADEVAELALERFIDRGSGVLHEFFDPDWRPLTGGTGAIEPGHQFEWAWLLRIWGDRRRRPAVRAVSRGLFSAGRQGFDPARGVVVNLLWDDLTVRDPAARLWPQCEFLKASLLLE
jgi:mannose-1-phosphate guanylyltransferase / mannose-6-phosphate isomerase